MKFVTAALVCFMSAIASASVVAPNQDVKYNDVFRRVLIDEKEQPSYVATASVQSQTNEIVVEVFEDICGEFAPPQPGLMRCMAAARAITTLRVPLKAIENSCGSMVYSGEKDDTPVDGTRTEIRVTDHSKRICMDMPFGAATIEASVFNPWTGKTTNYQMIK
jgi:hypothetical protein